MPMPMPPAPLCPAPGAARLAAATVGALVPRAAFTGHALAVWVTRRDPAFLTVLSRHARHKGALSC